MRDFYFGFAIVVSTILITIVGIITEITEVNTLQMKKSDDDYSYIIRGVMLKRMSK